MSAKFQRGLYVSRTLLSLQTKYGVMILLVVMRRKIFVTEADTMSDILYEYDLVGDSLRLNLTEQEIDHAH